MVFQTKILPQNLQPNWISGCKLWLRGDLGITAPQSGAIVYTNVTGASVSGQSITKTASAGWGNSGASSVASFNGNYSVSFSSGSDGLVDKMAGLSVSFTDTFATANTFFIYFQGGGGILIYEGGSQISGPTSTYTASDVFSVTVTNGVISYAKNGTIFYTSLVSAPTVMVFNVVMFSVGAIITNASASVTNGLVSQWNDISGSGNNVTQSTTADKPVYSFIAQSNNLPALTFNGTSQLLQIVNNVINTSPFTIFTVQQCVDNTNEWFSVSAGNTGNSPGNIVAFGQTSGVRDCYNTAAFMIGPASTTIWEYWTWKNDGTTNSLRVNGSPQSISNSTSQSPTLSAFTTIGAMYGSTSTIYWSGDIAEVIMFNVALSAANISEIENYLKTKYTPIPLTIPGAQVWVRADQGIVYAQGPVTATGTTPPTVTLTGTPTAPNQNIEIDISTTGARGTATFQWKLNGAVEQTSQTTAATFLLGNTGITVNFPTGTYTNDNVYKSVVVVNSWNDLSGNGYNFTVGSFIAPAYATNVYNGHPALEGIDATRSLKSTGLPGPGTTATIVYVFSPSSLASTYIGSFQGGADCSLIQNFGGTALEWFNGGGADRHTLASSVSAGLHQVVITQVDGVSLIGYYDGVQVFSATPTFTIGNAANVLFGYGGGANGTNGNIVEFTVYAGVALNATQVSILHNYSKAFWGTP